MERQIFINEMQARFNLRKPRSEKPTNLYLVCRINNKQVKLSTGVKIYPDHWNEKRQEADEASYYHKRKTKSNRI